ncbi:hypothetical protein GT350_17275 [Streptomyces sp. SID1034]|nr:hypothetical protein [Streptomyces sp. SID1034]
MDLQSDGDALTDAEFQQMNALLRRFCSHELDQFEALRTDTPYGPVYILLTRSMPEVLRGVELHDF